MLGQHLVLVQMGVRGFADGATRDRSRRVREAFGLTDADLNLDLGPLGKLL